jgi:adenylate cyclase
VDFAGDGVFVIYGAPTASEENVHARQALHTAVGMRVRVRELAAELRRRGVPADLQIRVGINTGHCTIGVFGSDVMRAYKAVGFPVNIASRLQTEADPGSILCGFRTYALAEDLVRAVRREPLALKGAARPVEAWEIVELVEAGRTGAAQLSSS